MVKISPDEIKIWSQYVHSITGIQLDSEKGYLFETRLIPLLQGTASVSFSELYQKVKNDPTGVLRTQVINAITTNETSFFRDTIPFELLKHKILPDLIDHRTKTGVGHVIPIRIWSAGCSTGQEVYSIAMVVMELLGSNSRYEVRLLATDISDAALAQASRGVYGAADMERGLTEERRRKFFRQEGDSWKVADELRARVSFRHLNLFESFGALGKFDIIFCRNVAIYFAEAEKKKAFTNLGEALEENGVLMIGATEGLLNGFSKFEPKRYLNGVYYQLKSKA